MTSIDVFEAARDLQTFCGEQGFRMCLIGGLAVQRWAQARVTLDVDATVLTGLGQERPYVEALLSHYQGRISDALNFALRSRVVLLRSHDGIGIDISLGGLPFEEQMIERSSPFEFQPGLWLRTCSAEDLLIMKLFAHRAIDIRDAEGIAMKHDKALDWCYVEEQLSQLAELKEEPEIMREFARIRELPSTV